MRKKLRYVVMLGLLLSLLQFWVSERDQAVGSFHVAEARVVASVEDLTNRPAFVTLSPPPALPAASAA